MDQAQIDAFWADARIRGGLNPASAYLGRTVDESLPPPAWAFGGDPASADALVTLVMAGTKTATSSARSEYEEDDDLPTPGMLSILLDSAGHPRALLRTTEVSVKAFYDVSEEHAFAEGEGRRSLSDWRSAHAEFFADYEPEMLVVLERFVVLTAHSSGHSAPVRQDA